MASLTNRIFLATALLAIVSIGVAIYVVNQAVTRQAEEELRRGLEEAARLVEHHRDLLVEHFTREARLLADLPKLKAAVATDHPPTVQREAEGYRHQLGADLFVVTNAAGHVLAELGVADGAAGSEEHPGVGPAIAGREVAWFRPKAGGVLQIVSVPIWDPVQPIVLGSLSVGFGLDAQVAERFKQLTHSEIAFAMDGRIQAATLADPERLSVLLAGGGITAISLAGEDYLAVVRSMAGGPDHGPEARRLGSDVAPVAVVLRSRTERLQFLRPLQTALAGTALVALLAATLLSYFVARTVTRPLGTITAAMREMAATGDLTRRITLPRGGEWDDEDTRLLAASFNTLTESLARFQREVAQRERLSSLGRLSTVVAHEIRNPLMIIKAALRTMRLQPADSARLHAAVADINEEVERLNRLVSDVLDFARPIQVECSVVDLNQLCREAAAASSADEDGAPIGVSLDPEVGRVRTDRERLRLVLVNLLNNARHAVAMRDTRSLAASASREDRSAAPVHEERTGSAAGAGVGRIELATRLVGDTAVAILVRDEGVGIRADDLPRVFDPFFTTKRTGSGLGLAIAKNIVDGLGGTITVESREGWGTEMRIELRR